MNAAPALLLSLALAACAGAPPHPMTNTAAREVCAETVNAPLVRAGIDPAHITIMAHTWTAQTERGLVRRMGEYNYRARRILTIDHREPLYHELIHRSLHLTGGGVKLPFGFRDEEHALIYFYLDARFPGLQAGRINATRRRWAAERWSTPDARARLAALEQAAINYGGWCDGRQHLDFPARHDGPRLKAGVTEGESPALPQTPPPRLD